MYLAASESLGKLSLLVRSIFGSYSMRQVEVYVATRVELLAQIRMTGTLSLDLKLFRGG